MKVRKEVHSRCSFAATQAEKWFKELDKAIKRGGSFVSGKYAAKYSQARRIYIHYTNEYQVAQNLPLTK